jgi:hypothetical protein
VYAFKRSAPFYRIRFLELQMQRRRHPELVSGSNEMLKQVQHDNFWLGVSST